ncbi:histidine kinase, partial [Mycobacteroides abscessus subsp. massiliense]
PDLEKPKGSGLGLFIIKTLMDDVDIESEHNHGTKIKMTKYLAVDM